jgi:hypothetical protein
MGQDVRQDKSVKWKTFDYAVWSPLWYSFQLLPSAVYLEAQKSS